MPYSSRAAINFTLSKLDRARILQPTRGHVRRSTALYAALALLLAALPLFAQLGPEPEVSDALGVNIHFVEPNPAEVNMLAASGVRWIRTDMDWSAIERAKGQYDFSAYDRLVAALDAHQLHALFILDYWNPLYDHGLSPASDEGRQAFAQWAAATVTHFKGHGFLWEIYNEPNWFWRPRPNAEDYIKLAMATCEAVREAAPDEKMIGPASAVIDPDFLEQCFRAGLLNYWSAVSIHPYRRTNPESAARDFRQVRMLIRKYEAPGKDIPIVASEWGYSSLWPAADERVQAAILVREWLSDVSNNVPLTLWYDWRDGNDPHDPEQHFGIVGAAEPAGGTEPFHPKTAYLAVQAATRFLAGFRFNKRLALEDPNDYLLLFTKGHEVRLVAWTTTEPRRTASGLLEPRPVLLPASEGEFAVEGMTGGELPAVRADRHGLPITLTREPQYLTPEKPNDLLLIAAGWRRLPLDIEVRSPGILPLHLSVTNPLRETVKFEAEAGNAIFESGPAEKAAPAGQASVEVRVESVTRSKEPLPIRIDLEASKVGRLSQTVWIVPTNPLRITVMPAVVPAHSSSAESELPILIANPTGDAVHAMLEAAATEGLRFRSHEEPVEMAPGAKEALIKLPLDRPPEAEYTLAVALFNDEGGLITEVPPSRFVSVDNFSRDASGSTPSNYRVVLAGKAAPAETNVTVGLPRDGSPMAGMAALKFSFRLAGDQSSVRLVPTSEKLAQIPGQPPSEPRALGLWLHGDGSGVLPYVQYTDVTGQMFHEGGGPIKWKGWRYVLIYLDAPLGSHSGGANDGVIHYPIHWDSLFMLQNPPGREVSGTVYVAAPTVIYGQAAGER